MRKKQKRGLRRAFNGEKEKQVKAPEARGLVPRVPAPFSSGSSRCHNRVAFLALVEDEALECTSRKKSAGMAISLFMTSFFIIG